MSGPSEIFDRIAASYDPYTEHPVAKRLSQRLLDGVRERLPRRSRILDVGCGPGHHAVALARLGYDVTALDVAPRMLEETRRRATSAGVTVQTIELDVTAAPIPGIYDGVYALMGPLSYVPDPEPILARIRDALVPDGYLWLGMARGAMLPILDPRLFLPMLGRPYRVVATVAGEPLPLYLWDPMALRSKLDGFSALDLTAVGVFPSAPAFVDRFLGTQPLLRRLGAASFITAVRRSRPTSP